MPTKQPQQHGVRHDAPYLDLLEHIMNAGVDRPDRTGVGTRGVFGAQLRFNLQEGFPLLTTKKVWFKGVAAELLWFLAGDTKVKTLRDQGVNIWNEWEKEDGTIGPGYGEQWRNWTGVRQNGDQVNFDQIDYLVKRIRTNPECRRLILNAWNVTDIPDMALAPCHCLAQFYVSDGKLSCQLYQRSADMFVGVPFNIASYALLTHLMAAATGLDVGDFVHTFGDAHIYKNHFEQVQTQLAREVRPSPQLVVHTPREDMAYSLTDFEIVNYNPCPAIQAPVAV